MTGLDVTEYMEGNIFGKEEVVADVDFIPAKYVVSLWTHEID